MKTLLIISLMTLISCVKIPKTIEHDSSLNYTAINGYKFHTVEFGNRSDELIIVVHGGPGGDLEYLKPLKSLSNNHNVIFYDQRGTGLSPRVDNKTLTVEQNLIDLNNMIDHYSKGRQVKLIGHSWGAMLTTAYLGRYPNKVSHAVIVEPGMLNTESAKAFVSLLKKHQSISDLLALIRYLSVYPFVQKNDKHEGYDYVMTKLLNRNKPGAPYQCANQKMPENAFKRGGYDAFNNMLKPIMDNPELFTYNLTHNVKSYKNKLLMISSECSIVGYDFQNKYHIPKLPLQTKHIEALGMGHNMLTINPSWSTKVIRSFFKDGSFNRAKIPL